MSQRGDHKDQPKEEQRLDVLTGEDVILDDQDVIDSAAIIGRSDPTDGQSTGAPISTEQGNANLPETVITNGEPAPSADPPAPLATDFPATSRVDISTAEELAETTSVLATDFTAPRRDDITQHPRDVLSGRAEQPMVGEDGETIVLTQPTVVDTQFDDVEDTTVLRRSLINAGTPEVTVEAIEVSEDLSEPVPETETSFDEAVLEGASILPTLPSRASGRWLSAIGTLLLAPVAWYLLTDSAVRLVAALDNPWVTQQLNFAALAELAGGIAVLLIMAVLATKSSLGTLLAGIGFLLVGLPFLLSPAIVQNILANYFADPLSRLGDFGGNLMFHFEFTGASGILVMVGCASLATAWVSYRIRRIGRQEEALRAEVVLVNPEGLHARWGRKASE